MSTRNFGELLNRRWDKGLFVSVGLDSEAEKLPKNLNQPLVDALVTFNCQIVEATKAYACAYKPNIAFYECHGPLGLDALQSTIYEIHKMAQEIPVILDFKRGDIGNSNKGYVNLAFKYLNVDAVTIYGYLGREAMQPFLEQTDKGIFVLCKTSNAGSGEFQDLEVVVKKSQISHTCETRPLYQHLALQVTEQWNTRGNCGLVVGATFPEQLKEVRKLAPELPILIPGIGTQGGDLEKTIEAGKDVHGRGMIINSSSGIIFASNGPDYAEAAGKAAEKLHHDITRILSKGE